MRLEQADQFRAVEPHDAAVLDLLLPGARQQRPIDRLPGLRPDRADCLVQRRPPRAPAPWQPGEGPERGGVLKVEGQFLVAELAVLLEERTAQYRLRGQAVPSGLLHAVAAQVGCGQADERRMLVEPRRRLLQLAADLVFGEQIEYAGLDSAVVAHCRLRRAGSPWSQHPESTRNRRRPPAQKGRFHRYCKTL